MEIAHAGFSYPQRRSLVRSRRRGAASAPRPRPRLHQRLGAPQRRHLLPQRHRCQRLLPLSPLPSNHRRCALPRFRFSRSPVPLPALAAQGHQCRPRPLQFQIPLPTPPCRGRLPHLHRRRRCLPSISSKVRPPRLCRLSLCRRKTMGWAANSSSALPQRLLLPGGLRHGRWPSLALPHRSCLPRHHLRSRWRIPSLARNLPLRRRGHRSLWTPPARHRRPCLSPLRRRLPMPLPPGSWLPQVWV